jgi:hypothetical protein
MSFFTCVEYGNAALNLARNAEIDTEDVYEILVGLAADETSIFTLYNVSGDLSPLRTRSSTIYGRLSK